MVIEQSCRLDELKLNALREAALLIALEQSKLQAIKEAEMRLQKGFLDEILAGNIASNEGANDRGKFFGLDLSLYNVLFFLEINTGASQYEDIGKEILVYDPFTGHSFEKFMLATMIKRLLT